jgi:hypothetical protein
MITQLTPATWHFDWNLRHRRGCGFHRVLVVPTASLVIRDGKLVSSEAAVDGASFMAC